MRTADVVIIGGGIAGTPDGYPIIGFDLLAQGFFWFAGQGGVQTAPALADLGCRCLTNCDDGSEPARAFDVSRFRGRDDRRSSDA